MELDDASSLIGPARRAELAEVRALLAETWHDTYDALYGVEEVTRTTQAWHAPANLARELTQDAHVLLVARAAGAIHGTASATLAADGTMTLGRLYVRPARQRRGLGAMLLDACLAQFPQARRILLEVDAGNAKGRAFYARQGFAERPERVAGSGNVVCERAVAPMPVPGRSRLLVRPVRDADAQDLFGLIALCFAEYPGCYVDPHDDLRDLRAPATATAERGGRFFVVEDGDGRIGACVSFDVPAPGLVELHRVYVRPDLRRRGLAAELVALAEDRAGAAGATRMLFWSDTRFLDAHRFYERLGYRCSGEERALGDISQSRECRFEKAL